MFLLLLRLVLVVVQELDRIRSGDLECTTAESAELPDRRDLHVAASSGHALSSESALVSQGRYELFDGNLVDLRRRGESAALEHIGELVVRFFDMRLISLLLLEASDEQPPKLANSPCSSPGRRSSHSCNAVGSMISFRTRYTSLPARSSN